MNSKIALSILDNLKKVIIGKEQVLENVLIALFARGHLLIEVLNRVSIPVIVNE